MMRIADNICVAKNFVLKLNAICESRQPKRQRRCSGQAPFPRAKSFHTQRPWDGCYVRAERSQCLRSEKGQRHFEHEKIARSRDSLTGRLAEQDRRDNLDKRLWTTDVRSPFERLREQSRHVHRKISGDSRLLNHKHRVKNSNHARHSRTH